MVKINFHKSDVVYPTLDDFMYDGYLYNEKFDFSHTKLPNNLKLKVFNYSFLSYYENYSYVVGRYLIYDNLRKLKLHIFTNIFGLDVEDNGKEFIFKGHLFCCKGIRLQLIDHYFDKSFLPK